MRSAPHLRGGQCIAFPRAHSCSSLLSFQVPRSDSLEESSIWADPLSRRPPSPGSENFFILFVGWQPQQLPGGGERGDV